MAKNPSKESYLFLLPWSLTSLGGVNQVVENLIRQMKKGDRYKPALMVNSWNDKNIRIEHIGGYRHHFFRLRNPWNHLRPVLNFIAFCVHLLFDLWQFLNFIKSNNISIVNVHYCGLYALNISLLKSLRLFRGRLILSFHGKDILTALETKGIERLLWKILINSADKIVTCSKSLKNDLMLLDRSNPQKIVVIHNGVDVSQLDRKRDLNDQLDTVLSKKRVILNIATFENKKGQDILVRAFKKIANEFSDLKLILIGRPGGTLKIIKSLISSLGLTDRVLLYEGLSHNKVVYFIKNATVFVLPSRYEPFGIVILEAGAFGVPVIASNVGGVSEILTHGRTGRLFTSEDVIQLETELRYFLDNPVMGKRLGENLKDHVIRNFSWKQAYQKYLDCVL